MTLNKGGPLKRGLHGSNQTELREFAPGPDPGNATQACTTHQKHGMLEWMQINGGDNTWRAVICHVGSRHRFLTTESSAM